MTAKSRTSRTLLGCGLGCGGALVLLIGGCFAFQAWLKGPGELLEPTAMLDPQATTLVALRLDLAEPHTRELVEGMLAAVRRPSDRLRRHARSPALDFFVSWDENRQRRDLARLFPMTAAWVVWPGEHDAGSVGAVVVSARGMGHQLIFMDWVLGLLAGRRRGVPTHIIAGERVYEVPLDHGDSIYAFLDPAGVVVCFDLASVAPAVERLRQHRAAAGTAHAPTELERRLGGVPKDLPLRGAVLGRHGEVAQLLGWLAPRAERGEWEPSWEPIEAATVGGRFTGGTRVALTVELAVDPRSTGARREQLLADLRRYFGEQWGAGKATVRPGDEGVTIDLTLDELPRRFEDLPRRRDPGAHGPI